MMKSVFRQIFRPSPSQSVIERMLVLADRTIPLKISQHARARRLTLRIEAGGKGVKVTMPAGTPLEHAESFVERHRGWIETRLQKLPIPHDEPMLKSGVKIPFLGTPHLIRYIGGRGTVKISQTDDGTPCLLIYGDERFLSRRLRDFYKKQAEELIGPLVVRLADEIGRKPRSIRYKDTVSRWGSCSADGALSFSWRIIMAPKSVVHYLVAHEVAHLIEMNHGPQFWALCERLCPDTKRSRAWLKRNGQALHAIDFES